MQQSNPQSVSNATVPTLAAGRIGPRFAFIHASWHLDIVQRARDGFIDEMQRLDVVPDAIDVYPVPGAFELPLLARKLALSGKYDAIVACALVVDGGIYRHDFVASAVVQGLMTIQLETDVPILSVVLTPHQFQPHAEHQQFFAAHFVVKGAEAARACMTTVQLLGRLGRQDPESTVADAGDAPDTIQ
jgi:6,7-dimethyl-8-ribityllumazine synthase